ncbi:MAG: (2Fe-2S) ferredoxin domain-containing protein [Planctomycetota bacterium]|nr:(2Fe-2S) ferredoxin domain-containing protein [Planctomycetota bacterium]
MGSANPEDIGPERDKVALSLGLGGFAKHVLLCTGPECVSHDLGMLAWDALKSGIKEEGLGKSCYRTKVGCLRVCKSGPVAVVYPEGVWYHSMTAERIPRLVKDHLVKDCLVEENRIGTYPLSESTTLS